MAFTLVIVETRDSIAGIFVPRIGSKAVEPTMNAVPVVVCLEFMKVPLKITGVPERYEVEVLPPDSTL